jgi:hypothetical protein
MREDNYAWGSRSILRYDWRFVLRLAMVRRKRSNQAPSAKETKACDFPIAWSGQG